MSIQDALYQVIVGHPEDDAPRLAYADALKGLDEPRAEFIRAQVRSAQLRRARVDSPELTRLVNRAFALMEHGRVAAEPLAGRIDKYVLRRGFVEEIYLDARRFLDTAAELYARAPVLDVNLTGAAAVAAELFSSPHLGRLRSLGLADNGLDDAAVRALASSKHLGKLAWLDLSQNNITAEGLEALAASKRLPRLGYLGFVANKTIDPTPRIGGSDEYGHFELEYPPAGRELAARHGARAWLTASAKVAWPPERDEV